jgi:flagellar basal-body rod protein FlgF
MESTSYIALSYQTGVERQMDVVANNIANMNTHGFKGERMMFIEHISESLGSRRFKKTPLSYVRDIATMTDVSRGALEKTGNSLDLAITGDGFFVVQTENGDRYTRNGRFKLDGDGQIVTQTGDPLLSDGGNPFFLSTEDTNVTISRNGSVSTNNGELGKIRLVNFETPQKLLRMADEYFSSETPPFEVETPEVEQGMLEGANVKPILEMAKLIEINRRYDSTRKFIEREDERVRSMLREYGQTV